MQHWNNVQHWRMAVCRAKNGRHLGPLAAANPLISFSQNAGTGLLKPLSRRASPGLGSCCQVQ